MKIEFDYEFEEEAEKSRQWYNPLREIGKTMIAFGVYVIFRCIEPRINSNKLEKTITEGR